MEPSLAGGGTPSERQSSTRGRKPSGSFYSELITRRDIPHLSVSSPHRTSRIMSDSASEIQIHVKGGYPRVCKKWRNQTDAILGANELKLQITIKTDKTVLELKQAIAEKTDALADQQRLIYSGKVLKVRLSSSSIPPRSSAYRSSPPASIRSRLPLTVG